MINPKSLKNLTPFKSKLAKERIPIIREYVKELVGRGQSKNQILGYIMQEEDIGSTFAHIILKDCMLTITRTS